MNVGNICILSLNQFSVLTLKKIRSYWRLRKGTPWTFTFEHARSNDARTNYGRDFYAIPWIKNYFSFKFHSSLSFSCSRFWRWAIPDQRFLLLALRARVRFLFNSVTNISRSFVENPYSPAADSSRAVRLRRARINGRSLRRKNRIILVALYLMTSGQRERERKRKTELKLFLFLRYLD